jgi:L-ascorbate metabolism protein UlaG (beta-lactamase superfamily)
MTPLSFQWLGHATFLFRSPRGQRILIDPWLTTNPACPEEFNPVQAAKACELLGVRQVVPMHFGTFPALTGTPGELRELVASTGVEVLELKPGETAR